jgi:malate dehydrogenase (oxaloacetate-decarboxylating)(NADP+)
MTCQAVISRSSTILFIFPFHFLFFLPLFQTVRYSTMDKNFQQKALDYHQFPTPGKLAIVATKPLVNQKDLALAYSPGVAAACEAIVENPASVSDYTSRGNLVAVISNGTAVLGLGNIGPLASKPVMEGKAVLFKKFANVDVFDIEVDELDPHKLVEVIAALEPTFGGINLEDIKAPECFLVERLLKERMNIPVFHDDQHGTAIIVAAAVVNALRLVDKKIDEVRLVTSGAGAAALACVDMLVTMGLRPDNIVLTDLNGVVHEGREEHMDEFKGRYARPTDMRTLGEAMIGADVFLGLSAAGVVKPDMVASMAARPVVMALANPEPEIRPDAVRSVRDDAIIATGRSDYPNQVNNVLCFPYIFRGALDVGATQINDAMKIACVKALADLALAEPSELVANAYSGQTLTFGTDYIIPKPFDPRLITELAPAVAKAAMESGVATRPIENFEAYKQRLSTFVFRSGLVMRPVMDKARQKPKRVVFAEGENERVLRAVQGILDEGLAVPILIGRPAVLARMVASLGLRFVPGQDCQLVNPEDNEGLDHLVQLYHHLMARRGISPAIAKQAVRSDPTLLACLLVKTGQSDAAVCGVNGRYPDHLLAVRNVIGLMPKANVFAALNVLVLPKGFWFWCDTYVNQDPSAAELAEITLMAAQRVRDFGIVPKVALLSHSNFGTDDSPSAMKMREVLQRVRVLDPTLEIEGEMHADAAVQEGIRQQLYPENTLQGSANLFIFPNLDAANIAYNMTKVVGEGLPIGPILLGAAKPIHLASASVTVRGIMNLAAIASFDAAVAEGEQADGAALLEYAV